jgi:ATP-binding cassette subfamily B protein
VLTLYAPSVIVARLLGAFADNRQLTADELFPYLLTFVALWASGQVAWRLAVALIARVEICGLEALYIEAMNELLAKDLAFFHNNYAGSLTKRALGFARRFEDVFDVMAFQVSASFLPLAFAGVVLWQCSGWLIVVLVGLLITTFALIVPRRRRE